MLSFLVPLLAAVFAGLVLAGAFRDLISYTIPNWISFGVLALFPVAALASGLSLPVVGVHVGVGAAMLVIAMGLFALRLFGGGDAKLLAATAFWMGWPAISDFVFWTAVIGGMLAMGLLTLRSSAFRPVMMVGPPWLVKLSEYGGGIPYGVAIAGGALMALPKTPLLASLAL